MDFAIRDMIEAIEKLVDAKVAQRLATADETKRDTLAAAVQDARMNLADALDQLPGAERRKERPAG